jgi:DNA-binding transcriptional MerR regulator
MPTQFLRTSDLARAVGIHPNTVRLYEGWGLIPPVERSPAGYRLFTPRHLECLRLSRMIYASAYPGTELRAASNEIIKRAVLDDWAGALERARAHLAAVQTELAHAAAAAALLEHWAQNTASGAGGESLAIGAVSRLLGVSHDVIRNWERNGLISVPRNPANGYRSFGTKELERLRVIRMLSRAGYSHMAILRAFIELDGGNTSELKKVLDVPRPDEDVFTFADRWLTTLNGQERLAREVIQVIEESIVARAASA